MPGRRGTERRATTEQVLVRLSADMAAALDMAADQDGLSVPAWIRTRLAQALELMPETALPLTVPRRAPAPEHILQIARLREVIAELGGAMTVAAVQTREQGFPVLHADIEAVLPGVKIAVRELDRLKRALDDGAPA